MSYACSWRNRATGGDSIARRQGKPNASLETSLSNLHVITSHYLGVVYERYAFHSGTETWRNLPDSLSLEVRLARETKSYIAILAQHALGIRRK